MRILALLVSLFILSIGCQADVYKTVDKDGNTVYTDNPQSDQAQKVKLHELNTLPAADPQPDDSSPPEIRPEEVHYQIKIISPRNDLIIPVGQRDLAIAISLDQPLHADHLLEYYMDGELLEETRNTDIIVRNIARGIHKISVEVMDQHGQSLGTSDTTSVNLMRPIIKKPASPKTSGN